MNDQEFLNRWQVLAEKSPLDANEIAFIRSPENLGRLVKLARLGQTPYQCYWRARALEAEAFLYGKPVDLIGTEGGKVSLP